MISLVCSRISAVVLVVLVGIVGSSALGMQFMLVVNFPSKKLSSEPSDDYYSQI